MHNRIITRLEGLNEYEMEALEAIYEEMADYKEALEIFESGDYQYYSGMNLEEVAEEMVDEGLFGPIPEAIIAYIDYEKIAYELSIDGYHETSKGVVKVN